MYRKEHNDGFFWGIGVERWTLLLFFYHTKRQEYDNKVKTASRIEKKMHYTGNTTLQISEKNNPEWCWRWVYAHARPAARAWSSAGNKSSDEHLALQNCGLHFYLYILCSRITVLIVLDCFSSLVCVASFVFILKHLYYSVSSLGL